MFFGRPAEWSRYMMTWMSFSCSRRALTVVQSCIRTGCTHSMGLLCTTMYGSLVHDQLLDPQPCWLLRNSSAGINLYLLWNRGNITFTPMIIVTSPARSEPTSSNMSVNSWSVFIFPRLRFHQRLREDVFCLLEAGAARQAVKHHEGNQPVAR